MEDTSARTPDELASSASHQTPPAPESGAAETAASAASESVGDRDTEHNSSSAQSANADASASDSGPDTGAESDGDQGDPGDQGDQGDQEQDAGNAGEEAGAAAEGGVPGKRKRRRRRKRKDGAPKDAASSSGDIAAVGVEGEARPEGGQKKKESHAPFAHRFAGSSGNKRHAFAVGEAVAGRVQKVEYGVIVVDLFGKALAMADEYEPREVPALPEPVEPAPEAIAPAAPEAQAEQAAAPEAQAEQAAAPEAQVEQAASAEGEQAASAEARAVVVPRDDAAHVASALSEAALGVPPEAAPLSAVAEAVQHAFESPPQHAQHAQDGRDGQHGNEASEPSSSGELQAAAHDGEDHEPSDEHQDDHDEAVVSVEPAREKPPTPALGQVFKGRVGAVSESGHIAILNRIIDSKTVRAQLAQFREQHKRVHGMVYGYNRGGFDVLVEGLRAFCPASAMSLEDIAEPLDFVGKKLEFLLPASKAGGKDIIVSRRSILERLQRRKTKEFLRGLTPGQRFKGKVTAVRDFGLFVDIGGIEGLVHQSELSFAFGVKPHNVAKVGDEVDVQVLRVGGEPNRGKEAGGKRDRLTRVSLSVKALLPDPWDAHIDALTEGAILKGKVVRAAEFGAFVEIAPEVEGLLHITELGRDLKHASQAVREGDEIYVAVERVDRKARRVSLSKLSPSEVTEFEAGNLTRDDSAARNLRQGNTVKVKIERIDPRCVFGRVVGTIGRRGRIFIPSSETGTERGSDLRKAFPIGRELEAKIIGTDRDGSFKCSVKAMQVDEERQAVKNYRREAAKQGFGTFGDLLRAKLGEAQK
jgi:small subunit ribosomal protein S1